MDPQRPLGAGVNRLSQRHAEVVAAALDYLPARLVPLVECDVFCADPLFAGLCRPGWDFEESPATGRSYRSTPHVCFPYHVADSRVTVVLPQLVSVATVPHELGHVLHWNLQERAGGWDEVPRLEPVTDYAEQDRLEEFAEAFVGWFYEPGQVDSESYWHGWSQPNAEFFDRLLT